MRDRICPRSTTGRLRKRSQLLLVRDVRSVSSPGFPHPKISSQGILILKVDTIFPETREDYLKNLLVC